jgi:hypothetical protein
LPERGPRGRPLASDPLFLLGAAVFALFGLPSVALAWGPSVHLWIGDVLLQTGAAAVPLVAALLRRHARAFLYGCLAPDFYVGKGSVGHDAHCHNWSAGKRLLAEAKDDRERAFALGYLAHLAADVIGHNHFVPNNLYRLFGVHKFGHVFFELHADNLLDPAYVDMADALVAEPNLPCDRLLQRVIPDGRVPFGAKKALFTSWITIHNRDSMKRLLRLFRGFSENLLRHDDVREMIELSLALAAEMLLDPEVPLLGRFDPIGAANIRLAKELRRASKRARAYARSDVPFPIPAELRALRPRLDTLDIEAYVGPLTWEGAEGEVALLTTGAA